MKPAGAVRGVSLLQRIGLGGGLLLFAAAFAAPLPDSFGFPARAMLAVTLLMAVFWLTEALPIGATALAPLALFPTLGIADAAATAKNYAEPNIFLFMGGFLIALAIERRGLHRRIALGVIAFAGGTPRRLLAGFLGATAFLSMWVSNTATALMMLPIGMAVLGRMERETEPGALRRFGLALMLGIAYASSIGGVATLVGTPPNIIFAGQAETLFPQYGGVGFVRWLLFGFPLAAGFLLITWAYLAFGVARKTRVGADPAAVREELKGLGPWSSAEKKVFIIFVATALLWITRADISFGGTVLRGWASRLGLPGVTDATVAMAAGLLLFIVPAGGGRREPLMDWPTAARMPWEVLLLFGGGFALADGFQKSGLADRIGGMFGEVGGLPAPVLVLLLCLGTTFSSEVTSNTAKTTMLMPVLAAASGPLGVHPYSLMVPATVAASFAFMLPSGTPPNAIVFGSGYVTVPQMAKAGFFLNLAGALWITLFTAAFAGRIFNF